MSLIKEEIEKDRCSENLSQEKIQSENGNTCKVKNKKTGYFNRDFMLKLSRLFWILGIILFICLIGLTSGLVYLSCRSGENFYVNSSELSKLKSNTMEPNNESNFYRTKMLVGFDNDKPLDIPTFIDNIDNLPLLGIHEVIIADSEIYTIISNNPEFFQSLLINARNKRINVSIALDNTFSWDETHYEDKYKNLFLWHNDQLMTKNNRIILNSKIEEFQSSLTEKIDNYLEFNITEFYIFNNPHRIVEIIKDKKEIEIIADEVDADLLSIVSSIIMSASRDIKVYYSYRHAFENMEQIEYLTPYSGSVVTINCNIFDKMLKDASLFSKAFLFNKKVRNKVIYFDINKNQFMLENLKFLGLYLFSPIDIVFGYSTNWFERYLTGSIHPPRNKRWNSLKNDPPSINKVLESILIMKKIHPYFSKDTKFLSSEMVGDKEEVLVASRGKNEEGIRKKMILFLFYSNGRRPIWIKLDEVFKLSNMVSFTLLYDNFNLTSNNITRYSNKIKMKVNRVVVIQVN